MLTPRHVQAIASTRDRNMLVLRRLFVDAHGSFKSLLSSDTDGHLSDELWAVRTHLMRTPLSFRSFRLRATTASLDLIGGSEVGGARRTHLTRQAMNAVLTRDCEPSCLVRERFV